MTDQTSSTPPSTTPGTTPGTAPGAASGPRSDYRTAFTVDRTPDQVFAAVNDVRGWWTGEIEGVTDTLGGEFTYRYEDVHLSRQRITELVPGRRVAWLVVDARLSFTRDDAEWIGTTITFDIVGTGTRTELRFTHVGLVPQVECFESCSNAWGSLVNGNLRRLIEAA